MSEEGEGSEKYLAFIVQPSNASLIKITSSLAADSKIQFHCHWAT